MKIAILAAMSKELRLLLDTFGEDSQVRVNGLTFHIARHGDHELIVGQSGIGKVNAAVGTLTVLDNFHPALVINSGVAGGVGVARPLDVVIPDRIAYYDVWCGPGTEPGQADGMPRIFTCPLDAEHISGLGARSGLLASGDTFVSSRHEVDHILSLYPDAVAVDMESAAMAQVCHIKGVPFICLRVVSDTPGQVEDNAAQYTDFWTQAPENTFGTLRRLLDLL